jgi:hypothetical protein
MTLTERRHRLEIAVKIPDGTKESEVRLRTFVNAVDGLEKAMSAFKFFYHQVLKSDTVQEQHRPRQDKRLPI